MLAMARRAFIALAPHQTHLTRRAKVTGSVHKDERPASSMLDFLEDPVDQEFRDDYATATMDQGDFETIHEYQSRLREKIPPSSSNKRELNTRIRDLLTSFGWAEEAFEMVVSSSYKNGGLRSKWLEFQIRSFIAHGEPENALRIFDHLVDNLAVEVHAKLPHSPSSSLIIHVIHTILRHEIVVPVRTLSNLTKVLLAYPEFQIPNRTIKAIVELYANQNAYNYLRRIVMEWARYPARFEPTLLAEVANQVILVAERTKNHKTASSWYSLHRHITNILLEQHKKKPDNIARGNEKTPGSHSSGFTPDATPYVTMAQFRIKRRPRRLWRVIRKMLQDTMADGVSPNTAMVNLILRTARAGRRYDRAFEFFEAAYHRQLLSNAALDAYAFCTMWKCIDETRNLRSAYHEHPARPTGVQLFNMLLSTHFILADSSRSNAPSPQSDTPTASFHRSRSTVLTKGTLTLALTYFMNDQAYAEALVVLRTFLAFNIQPNERTKWAVNMAILRRAVGEMKQRLSRGYVTCATGQHGTHSLSWAERLIGVSSGVIDDLSNRERWCRLKYSRAYSMRQKALEAMIKSLEQHRSARPRMPVSAPRVVREIWSMTVDSSTTDPATQPPVIPDLPDTNDETKLGVVNIHSLLEIVGRCALASQGIQSNADIRVRRETLESLIREAEREMLLGQKLSSVPAIRINVQARGGFAVRTVAT